MNDRNDAMRRLLELAVNYGRKHRSSQTGYLHYCYGNPEEPHLPIPLYENFLLALALLRTRLVENIQEAKVLLEGLIHFQNKVPGSLGEGNFPIYIHDYPICKDRFVGAHLVLPLYWILKNFSQVIGHELKKKLENAFIDVLNHSLKTHEEKPAPYPIALKIAAAAKAGGDLLHEHSLQLKGEQLLEKLVQSPDYTTWYSPSTLGTMLTALIMAYPKLSDSPWSPLWKYLSETWHRHTGTYIGPALRLSQEGHEPKVTTYDLIMGYLTGVFSARVLKENPAHLEAVLIPAYEDILPNLQFPVVLEGNVSGDKWLVHHDERIAYSIIDKENRPLNPPTENGYHPLRIIWGDLNKVHSLVCQGGNCRAIHGSARDGNIILLADLGTLVEVEDKEKSREVVFFIDVQDEMGFLVEDHKSSTFQMGETLSIKDSQCSFTLAFLQEEGQGKFLGHRMLGNRPSQVANKGQKRYEAYDWMIFPRTIRRTEPCQLKVEISYSMDKERDE